MENDAQSTPPPTTPVDPKSQKTTNLRIKENKLAFLESLRTVPITYVAAKKAGVDKSTAYRWLKEDKEFAKQVNIAKKEGILNVHERAFSILVKNGTDSDNDNWRAALELMRYLDRIGEDKTEKVPSSLSSILSNPQAIFVLSEILKIAAESMIKKEEVKK